MYFLIAATLAVSSCRDSSPLQQMSTDAGNDLSTVGSSGDLAGTAAQSDLSSAFDISIPPDMACGGTNHGCSGQCVSNSGIDHCGSSCTPCVPPSNSTANCDGTTCGFTCNVGFYASNGTCHDCSTCVAGQYVGAICSSTTDTTCPNCTPIPHCVTETCASNSDQTCTTCHSGYYVAGGGCSQCGSIANCATVTCTGNSNQSCTNCNSGYYVSSGTCSACTSILNCATVACSTNSNQTCTSCNSGYFVSGGTCSPCTAISNCAAATCSTNSDQTCTTCNGGYLPCGNGCCTALAISAGGDHTCALTSAGGVVCWGDNLAGRLGNNSTTASSIPVNVSGLASGITAISAGSGHTCALTSGGGVLCWGVNNVGQLGNNTTTNSSVPVSVSGLSSGIIAILAADGDHSCALRSDGRPLCWGYNGYGELGDNSTNDSHVPALTTAADVTSISGGGGHTCATEFGGVMGVAVCWGYNHEGELGNGSTTNSSVPVIAWGSGISAVSAGSVHSCALTSSGAVLCWGGNSVGQLGNNSTTDSHVPVVTYVSGVTAVSAGGAHSCALTSGGAVQCWGQNESGELGNNSTTDSSVPVNVSGITSGIAAISVGANHTCALTAGGNVLCWGNNTYGQLGNGSTIDSHIPVSVSP